MSTRKDSKRTEKAHCNDCLQTTKHFVLAERKQNFTDDDSWFRTTYSMLECCGCGNVRLREKSECSDWEDTPEWFYPPNVSRQAPKWHSNLPNGYRELLREVYSALQADSRTLVMMGARTLIDMFITDKVGDVGGFTKKLEMLVDKGYLSAFNRDILDAALQAGHAASHRGHKPSAEEVIQVIDIVENLLQSLVLQKAAKSLRKATPKRKRSCIVKRIK
jgi:hypothetical protein